MAERVEALVTSLVLRWARERARLSIEEAAGKLKRPVEDILAWEAGMAPGCRSRESGGGYQRDSDR